MRLLVFGARGMLGTDLVPLCAARHLVRGVDIEEVDITDKAAVAEEVARFCPEAVINAAAYTDVDGSEENPETAFKVNADGVEHIAAACRASNAALYHLSTDYVFDGQKQSPYTEEDQPRPLGVYGRSKWEGEQRARRTLERLCVVRTAWLYGRAGRNFVKAILSQASSKSELRVVADQRGSPTYTKDLARALLALVECGRTGTYHVTNAGSCSWYEFAVRILEWAGIRGVRVTPITTQELGRRAPRPAFSVMDCSRFERHTGTRLRHWESAVKEYLAAEGLEGAGAEELREERIR
jgi:dTDP-4-dehydrorhamnose reductase